MKPPQRIVLIDQGNVVITNFENPDDISIEPPEDRLTNLAYLDWHGNTASPSITITKPIISVQLEKRGGGRVEWSRLLAQSGAFYYFHTNGNYEVEPGTYIHYVYGYIGGDDQTGRISSTIKYK